MPALESQTRLHVPTLHLFEHDGLTYAVDAAAPNWIVIEPEGRRLLDAISAAQGALTVGDLVRRYAAERGFETGRAWLDELPACASLAGACSRRTHTGTTRKLRRGQLR